MVSLIQKRKQYVAYAKRAFLITALSLVLAPESQGTLSDSLHEDLGQVSTHQSEKGLKGTEPVSRVSSLPDAVLLRMIRQVDPQTRNSLALVDQRMHDLVRDPTEMVKRQEDLSPRSEAEFHRCMAVFARQIEAGVLVDLSDQPWVDDKILAHLTNAKQLKLNFCDNITNVGLASLGKVTNLSLIACKQIDDEGLKHLPNVRDLALTSCENITGAGFVYLHKLESLLVGYCYQVFENDDTITSLLDKGVYVLD